MPAKTPLEQALTALIAGLPMTPVPAPTDPADPHLPYITHTGRLDIPGGMSFRCYQLSTGVRVVDADDVEAFFCPPD